MKTKQYINAGKMLSGELSNNEAEQFNAWLNKNEKNMKWFNTLKKGWDVAGTEQVRQNVDVDRAWNALYNKIQKEDSQIVITPVFNRNKSLIPVFLRVAAIGLILIAFGMIGYKLIWNPSTMSSDLQIVQTIDGEQKNVTLPDGTTVFLSYSSKLSYPKQFSSDKREVTLSGDAYFAVTKNLAQPFIISAGDAVVRVVGTSFSVRSGESKDNVEVFVNTGKVEVFSKNSPENVVALEPGYLGSITEKETKKYLNNDENYLSWKTKKIVFNNSSLEEVVSVLSQTYHVNLVLDKTNLEDCRFTSSFENQELDIVLQIINQTLGGLQIDKKETGIYISGKGCE
jgi:transmembrane sensor